MEPIIYKKKHTLLMRDCDMFRRIRPSVILTMFQDCSEALTEGWGVGLEAMLQRDVIWVAAKAGCSIARLPVHGETVVIRGWAGRCRSGIFPFQYVIEDTAGSELIRGCSLWVLSDLKSHTMLSDNIPKITLPTPEPEDAPLPRMKPIARTGSQTRSTRRVRFSEVDINGHLTNTRYLDWVCDLIPSEFHRDHPITGIRADYRCEVFPDEEVVLDWELTGDRMVCAGKGHFLAMLEF